jgi:hypothetical protein
MYREFCAKEVAKVLTPGTGSHSAIVAPPPPAADAVMVLPAIPNVTVGELLNTTRLLLPAVEPATARVLPPSPAPPPDGTLIRMLPALIPTEAIPAPTKLMLRISTVLLLDCPVVLLIP